MFDWLVDALSYLFEGIVSAIYAVRDFLAKVLGEAARLIFAATMFLGLGIFSILITVFQYTPVGTSIRNAFDTCVAWTGNGPFVMWLFVDVLAFDELLPLLTVILSLEVSLWVVQISSAPIRRLLNSV